MHNMCADVWLRAPRGMYVTACAYIVWACVHRAAMKNVFLRVIVKRIWEPLWTGIDKFSSRWTMKESRTMESSWKVVQPGRFLIYLFSPLCILSLYVLDHICGLMEEKSIEKQSLGTGSGGGWEWGWEWGVLGTDYTHRGVCVCGCVCACAHGRGCRERRVTHSPALYPTPWLTVCVMGQGSRTQQAGQQAGRTELWQQVLWEFRKDKGWKWSRRWAFSGVMGWTQGQTLNGARSKGALGKWNFCRGEVGRKRKYSGKGEQRGDKHRALNSSLEVETGIQSWHSLSQGQVTGRQSNNI